MGNRYAIIGAGGYIAPRHMAAIQSIGGQIVLACDESDSVGILDSFEDKQESLIQFTTSPNDFFQRLTDRVVDTVVVVTPNGQHTSHAVTALMAGCDVVVEKPLGICGEDADKFIQHAKDYQNTVYPVVQLRHHPHLGLLRDGNHPLVQIDYGVYRGDWYHRSWKGNEISSGGLLMNLGVHLFDLCIHLWGEARAIDDVKITPTEASGVTIHEHADVEWSLACNQRPTRRVFKVNGHSLDMSSQIGKLHEAVYRDMKPWPLEDVARAIHLIDRIKRAA